MINGVKAKVKGCLIKEVSQQQGLLFLSKTNTLVGHVSVLVCALLIMWALQRLFAYFA